MDEKKEKINQIIFGTLTFIISFLIDKFCNFNDVIMFCIYLVPYIITGYETFEDAYEEIKEGNIFNEGLLMIIATLGAMFIGFMPNSENMYSEAIFVMLFFQVGELFEIIAQGKTEKEVKSLMDIRPDYANIEKEDKTFVKVSPKDVKVGDEIIVNPGEKVPLDGVIVEGESQVNTLAITGESVPRLVKEGDTIYSGFINKNGILKVKTTKSFTDSTASKIIDLVKNASEKKSKSEKFITKFSRVYTPIVIFLALLIAVVPSIITGNAQTWIVRGLTFLIVSCPCALVISVPLSFFGGIGGASKKGVLFKGSNYLEAISKMNTVILDKTGTLTEGVFVVTTIHPEEMSEDELLHIVSHIESHSNHPIATSLINSYSKDLNDDCILSDVKEVEGYGISAKLNDKIIYVGNTKLMNKIGIKYKECRHSGTVIHVATKDKYYGHIVISDKIKEDAKETIDYFRKNNIKTVMLSGDKIDNAKSVADELGIDKYYGELLPQDKVNIVSEISKTANVGFVGDGINDSPSLARADIGISLGGIGQDAAIEASDVILMQDKLSSIIDAINISKRTIRIANENIIFSIAIKILVLILSAFGITKMWMAVFADVGVTVIAVLNSMRTLKKI